MALVHQGQRTHWWYAARRRILREVLRQVAHQGVPEGRWYDLGCGVGANLPVLESFGPTVGVDGSPAAVAFCRQRGHADVQLADVGDLRELPAGSGSVALLADVLEHIADEQRCLAGIRRLLAPGGALVVTVPAFAFLWGPSDEANHHQRRYTERGLCRVLEQHFRIEWSTYFNALLFGLVAGGRLLERALGRSGLEGAAVPPWPVNPALAAVFSLEARLVGRVHLPLGVSLLVVARKR